MNQQILNALDGYADMIKAVKADSDTCKSILQFENEYQSIARILVSSIFRGIEGIVNTAAILTIEFAKFHNESPILIAEMQEKRFKKTEGELLFIERDSRLSLKKRVKFIYNYLSKYRLLDLEIDYSSKGGKDFIDAVKVRDKITHPKSVKSMLITREEMLKVQSGFKWFMRLAADSCKTNRK